MARPGVQSLWLGHSSNRSTAHHQRNRSDSSSGLGWLMHSLSEDQDSAHCISLGDDVWRWAGARYTRAGHRGQRDNAGGMAGRKVEDKQTNKTMIPPRRSAVLCLVLPAAAADAPGRESGFCFYLESNFSRWRLRLGAGVLTCDMGAKCCARIRRWR